MLRAVIVKFADPTLLIASDIDDIARLAGAIAKMDFLVLREIAIKPQPALASFTLVGDSVLWYISEVERRRVVAALVAMMHIRSRPMPIYILRVTHLVLM